jgi:hypothetical protein
LCMRNIGSDCMIITFSILTCKVYCLPVSYHLHANDYSLLPISWSPITCMSIACFQIKLHEHNSACGEHKNTKLKSLLSHVTDNDTHPFMHICMWMGTQTAAILEKNRTHTHRRI